MMRPVGQLLTSLVLSLSPAAAASLHGLVLDHDGSRIPRARITLFAAGAQPRLMTLADAEGRYSIDDLAPGQYLVQADAPGLTRRTAAVTLADSDTALDLTLDLAEVRTEVVVTATGSAQATDEIAKSIDTF